MDYGVGQSGGIARPAGKRWRRWLIGLSVFMIAAAGLAFFVAVYLEVASRDAQLRAFLQSARGGATAGLAGESLLSGLSGIKIPASTTVTVDQEAASGAKNLARQLAEKPGRPRSGNASSSLVIVEFIDFQCPICLQEFPIIREIANKYDKDILYIIRNYPVIDQNSMMFAQAGMCAEEQGRFWPFHDRLYAAQGQIASLQDFQRVAAMAGLDWNKLQDCVNKEKYKPQVLEDMSDALDLGVRGTPTFFVNGKKLEGAVTAAVWEEIISRYKQLNK